MLVPRAVRSRTLTLAALVVFALVGAGSTGAHVFEREENGCTITYGEHCIARPDHPVAACQSGHRVTDCDCLPAGCIVDPVCVPDIPTFVPPQPEVPENGLDDDCDGSSDNLRLVQARHSSAWPAAVGYQSDPIFGDRALVAWTDASSGAVMTQFVLADGSQPFVPQTVFPAGAIGPPAVATTGLTNPPLVAWTTASGILARVLNDDGTTNPQRPPLLFEFASDAHGPRIAKMSHNRSDYLLTWLRGSTVFGRIVAVNDQAPGGAFAGPVIQISPTGAAISPADVAFDYLMPSDLPETNPGQYLVVWPTFGVIGIPAGIYGRFVKQNGELGASVRVSAPVNAADGFPALAFAGELATGRLFVAWTRALAPLGRSQIVARRVNEDGSLEGPELMIDDGAPEDDSIPLNGRPSVALSPALGQFFVTWGRQEPNGLRHPVGRMVNVDGTIVRGRLAVSPAGITDPNVGDPVTTAAEPTSRIGNPGSSKTRATIYGYCTIWRSNQEQGNLSLDIVDRHLDSDGDALLDEWETGAIDLNNDGTIDETNDLDLRALDPANPPSVARKDLYLEIDWMDCALGGCSLGDTHSHRLRDLDGDGVPEIVELMVEAFGKDQSPSFIDGGSPGFNAVVLHVDYGQLGGGTAVAHAPGVPANSRASGLDRRRRRVFRYGLATHQCCGASDLPGSFFWAGRGGDDSSLDIAREIAAHTFMHEFGHTLGLTHGGGDGINYKPNYLSIMNYTFSGGIPAATGPPLLDYAHAPLPDLDEHALNEAVGIQGDGSSNALTLYYCPPDANNEFFRRTGAVSGPINWDCDDPPETDSAATVSVNGDYVRDDARRLVLDADGRPQPVLGVLAGGDDDWSHLYYNFRAVGNYGASAAIPPSEDLPSPEEIHEGLALPRIRLEVTDDFPPRARPYSVTALVANDGAGTAKNVALTLELFGQASQFDLGTLAPGNTVTRAVTFDAPPTCRPASILRASIAYSDVLNGPLAPVSQKRRPSHCRK